MKLQVVDYSDKAIAVFGATSETEARFLAANGLFLPKLKTSDGTEKPGWVFSARRRAEVEKIIETGEIVAYSEKSIAVFPELENHAKALLGAKGIFNAHLKTADGQTAPGYIFSKKHQDAVVAVCKSLS